MERKDRIITLISVDDPWRKKIIKIMYYYCNIQFLMNNSNYEVINI